MAVMPSWYLVQDSIPRTFCKLHEDWMKIWKKKNTRHLSAIHQTWWTVCHVILTWAVLQILLISYCSLLTLQTIHLISRNVDICWHGAPSFAPNFGRGRLGTEPRNSPPCCVCCWRLASWSPLAPRARRGKEMGLLFHGKYIWEYIYIYILIYMYNII